MLLAQHILCAKLDGVRFDDSQFVAAVAFPDAIRRYSGARQFSHFEKGSDGVDDSSWWSFPPSMKNVTKESITDSISLCAHKSSSIRPAVIGEDTDIEAFYSHNTHLPEPMFAGIKAHLEQDMAFDDFIRTQIDCSKKYDDEYTFKGTKYDGKGVRSLIEDIEQYGIYVLAHEVYESTGEVTDAKWFDDNIKPIFDERWPQDLADGTFTFIKIDPKINELIQNKDWSKLNDGPVSYDDCMRMYSKVVSTNVGPSAMFNLGESKYKQMLAAKYKMDLSEDVTSDVSRSIVD